MVVPIFNRAPTFLCFSMWVQRSFQCIIQISTIQEKVKTQVYLMYNSRKKIWGLIFPLTPMPKGHSDSIDDNLPALPAYKGMLALLVIPSVFRCTVLPALILSFFLMFSTAAPSLCFQYFFDNSYFKFVGGHRYGEELF